MSSIVNWFNYTFFPTSTALNETKTAAATKIASSYRMKNAKTFAQKIRHDNIARILITSNLENGFGDYSKAAKTLKMLEAEGYNCKILLDTSKKAQKMLPFLEEKYFINNRESISAFKPNLIVCTPSLKEHVELAYDLGIPFIGIREYGYKPSHFGYDQKYSFGRDLFKEFSSGIEGLGMNIDPTYTKKYTNPKEHLKELPEIYQRAIFGEDFDMFTEEHDFYFGYAHKAYSLMDFVKAIVSQKNQDPSSNKKVTFYFMGDTFYLPTPTNCGPKSFLIDPNSDGTFKIQIDAQYKWLTDLNIKSITVKKIDKKTGKIAEEKMTFKENPDGIEINIATGHIDNSFVPPLIHAAQETFTTGDESFAEVYACKKVPLCYETLSHKARFRYLQLKDIFENLPNYKDAICSDNVGALSFQNPHEPSYTIYTELLEAKKDPHVQQALKDHLEKVHSIYNFRKNLIKEVKTIIMQSRNPLKK